MNSPAPAEQNRPPVTGNAFNTAQLVFANGWIDIEDLDRVCHPIANAPDEATAEQVVADLASVDKRVARQADSSAQGNPKKPTSSSARRSRKAGRLAADLVFGLLLLAFAINLLAWGIITVMEGPQYFWPVWMLLPLTIVGVGWGVTRWNFREDRG